MQGEKDNATKLLRKLMQKYAISEEDLKQEKIRTVWVVLKNDAERKICRQILYAYFDNANLYKRYRDRTKYWTKLTPAQEIEFKYMLSVYLKSFYEEEEIFIRAFIQKNHIFPANGPTVELSDLSAEEREKAMRAELMKQGIEFTRIRKALEDKKGEQNEFL